jgi:dUTP pyrophosphatase
MKIKMVLEPGAKAPHRSTEGAAGWDLFANIEEPIKLHHGESALIPTGVRVQLPKGFYWDIRIRSGLSTKKGIILANGAGVVDEDYRGIVGVPVINLGGYYEIQPGEKIAQAILQLYAEQDLELVDKLEETERGNGGFGSTGNA